MSNKNTLFRNTPLLDFIQNSRVFVINIDYNKHETNLSGENLPGKGIDKQF